jgi:hypothetical protein
VPREASAAVSCDERDAVGEQDVRCFAIGRGLSDPVGSNSAAEARGVG